MALSKQHLMHLREQAVAKRQAYVDMVHQADGAIGVLDLLLSQLDQPNPESPDAPDPNRHDQLSDG
jgi:hypothetical protein